MLRGEYIYMCSCVVIPVSVRKHNALGSTPYNTCKGEVPNTYGHQGAPPSIPSLIGPTKELG